MPEPCPALSPQPGAVLSQDPANGLVSIPPLLPDRPQCLILTVILALDKGLPLPEPLHADTVDDAWRLLCLESLVQLGEQEQRYRKDFITSEILIFH